MPKRLGAAKQKELKEKFWQLDNSHDNKLNFGEMKTLLKQGNPNFTEKELQSLFRTIDTNNNGSVDFDEFVEFLYGVPRVWKVAPEAAKEKFNAFCGKDMDSSEFTNMCIDCGIVGRQFMKQDAAILFKRVVPRNQLRINTKPGGDGFSDFDKLLVLVAEKKEVDLEYIHELVVDGEKKQLNATIADSVRLHDDKSTYTGAQGFFQKPAGSPRPASADEYDIGPPSDWEPIRLTYRAFQREGGGLTNREWAKLCEDSNICDGTRFVKGDADIIFSKLNQRGDSDVVKLGAKLNWEKFQEAVTQVAWKKRQQLEDVMAQIAECKGPTVKCTVADEVRLHDDKEAWTGTRAG